jgi:hypothetical protein
MLAMPSSGAVVSKSSTGWEVETTTTTLYGDNTICDTGAAGYYADLESIVLKEATALYWFESEK